MSRKQATWVSTFITPAKSEEKISESLNYPEGEKSKWVFVCDHEFSERYMSEFGLLSICDAGFEVEIWVLQFKNVSESKPAKPNESIQTRFIDSLSELSKFIADLTDKDILTPVSALAEQNRATDEDVQKCLSGAVTLVCFDHYSQALFQRTAWSHLRALAFTPRLWKSLVNNLWPLTKKTLKFRVPRLIARSRFTKSPMIDFIFSIGSPCIHDEARLKTPSGLKELPVMERAMVAANAHKSLISGLEPQYILIIDPGGFFHTDNEKLRHIRVTQDASTATAIRRKEMLIVTTFLSQFSNYKVRIAAHPNANYPQDIFDPFELYYGDTLELMESTSTRLVVTFGSSMAITASYLGIPQCVVDTETNLVVSLSCIRIAKALKIPLWPLRKPTSTWVVPSGFNAESTHPRVFFTNGQQYRITRPGDRASLAISTIKGHLGHPGQGASPSILRIRS